MSSKFKVGDEFIILEHGDVDPEYIGKTGTVTRLQVDGVYGTIHDLVDQILYDDENFDKVARKLTKLDKALK